MKDSLASNLSTTRSNRNVKNGKNVNHQGTAGNDFLMGGGVFEGGKGNDTICAQNSGSKDTLRFSLGDGKDSVYSYDWEKVQDTVQFGNGITADMIGFSRNGEDLVVTVGNQSDQIVFKSFFVSDNHQTFTRFEFTDGTVWSNIKETTAWKNGDWTLIFRGTNGDDILEGSGTFEGGKGNDTIYAQRNRSKDTLYFNLGDGKDTIYSSDWEQVQDTVQFGQEITANMVGFDRNKNDLIVLVGDQGDQMTFKDFFSSDMYQTFTRFEFADGTVWSNIKNTTAWRNSALFPVIKGTNGNDILKGSGIFEGGKGNDTIYVQQDRSQDTLRFNLGDGQDTVYSYDWSNVQDTVQFGKGVTAGMISFARSGKDLVVTVGSQGDQITFKSFFDSDSHQTFTRFEFADGTVWNNIKDTSAWKNGDWDLIIRGTNGDDILEGSGIFDGGKGNDTIYAQQHGSQDTLRFNLGDGQDTVYSYDWSGARDTVQFGKDVTAGMIGFVRSGKDLVVTVGSQGDQITFKSFFTDNDYQTFTRFEFADGTVWNNIKDTSAWKNGDWNPIIKGTNGDDILEGSGIFEGGKGNDTFYIQQHGSQDILRFNLGDGKDTIYSQDWDKLQDTVQFGKGITTGMIGFTRNHDDLVVTVGSKGDQMTFKEFFASSYRQTFTRFEFANGTVWHNIKDTEAWKNSDLAPIIRGTDGDDVLWGSGIFEAGKGNDTIHAEQNGSQDTLRFNLGDGKDTIYSQDWYGLQDTVQFGKGITARMIDFSRNDNDLVVNIGSMNDQMTFKGFFNDWMYQTFTRFEFADGSIWNNIQETATWKNTDWTPVNRGTNGNDILEGSGTFEGGKGNDIIYAERHGSKDTLRFNLGDGKDTIYSSDSQGVQDTVQFGKNVTESMIGFSRSDHDLVVAVGNQGDQMTFKNFFLADNFKTFTRFTFANGTTWQDIRQTCMWKNSKLENVIQGTNGDDILTGNGVFEPGKGNDVIYAQEEHSQDTLRFNLGDGKDTVYSYDPYVIQDTVEFGAGITPEMITFLRNRNSLVVVIGNQGDQITFNDYFHAGITATQTFSRFEFANGTIWNDIQKTDAWKNSDLAAVVRGTDGDDNLSGGRIYEGGKGDDTITLGGIGNEVRFNLGDGKDTIISSGINHRIRFGKDVTADMISFKAAGNDVIIVVGNRGDQITLSNYLEGEWRQSVRRFNFSDGTQWNNFKDSQAWRDSNISVRSSASFSNEITNHSRSFSAESLANQASSLITAMATFSPQEGGVSLQPEQNALAPTQLLASSAA